MHHFLETITIAFLGGHDCIFFFRNGSITGQKYSKIKGLECCVCGGGGQGLGGCVCVLLRAG